MKDDTYSPTTAFIFIFNLIVGAGALTQPHAFSSVGIIYGTIFITFLSFVSYVTATFLVEVMAGVNALILYRTGNIDQNVTEENMPLVEVNGELEQLNDNLMDKTNLDNTWNFKIVHKIEMAQAAQVLLGNKGLVSFYVAMILYLYGDLAIYAVAVPKSLREITCPRPHNNMESEWRCVGTWNSVEVYRLYVGIFALVLGPFAFGNVQKTRIIQIISTILRHVSFILMIMIALIGISRGKGRSVDDVFSYEYPMQLPTFFGVVIYSFMCHHSLPSLITPIDKKEKVGFVLAMAFAIVLIGYLILCITAAFRFQPNDISDVYTLNFKRYSVRFIAFFLGLFPVFTLSTSFPLIAITLRENIKTLCSKGAVVKDDNRRDGKCMSFMEQNMYAFLAVAPPIITALLTENVAMLVGITGSYAGLVIQWVIPASLVLNLRLKMASLNVKGYSQTTHHSPFKSKGWVYLAFGCASVAVILVTTAHLIVK